MELSRAGRPFVVVERAAAVGGLSRTRLVTEGEYTFRTDTGPHRFFSKNAYLYEFIGGLLEERWIVVRRQTRQYIDGQFFDYPVNAGQVLRNLGPVKVARVLWDYAIAQVQYSIFRRPIRHFKDFAYANFGRTLAEFNIINYTEKVWGVSTESLHQDWAGQRISGLNIVSVGWNLIRRALGGGAGGPKSLVDEFYYPDCGTGLIYETIRERIESAGNPVHLEAWPTRVSHADGRVTAITLNDGREIAVDQLVESVHITDFVQLMDPPPPPEVIAAATGLRYRHQVYLFLTLDRESVTADQWIYFPKPEVPFDRWSEMRNFSARMSPAGKTSLFIEFFCFPEDAKWSMSAEELLALVLPVAEAGKFFTRAEVRHAYKFSGGKDYPLYDLEYRERLAVVQRWLDGFSNLYNIGRPGRFKYTNQDHSLEMGMLAAWSIVDGKRRDIGAVGSEGEYFEKGAVPTATRNAPR